MGAATEYKQLINHFWQSKTFSNTSCIGDNIHKSIANFADMQ